MVEQDMIMYIKILWITKLVPLYTASLQLLLNVYLKLILDVYVYNKPSNFKFNAKF